VELISSTPPGEIIKISRDISSELMSLRRTAWQLAAAGAAVLMLGLVGGWWAAGRSLRPIASMSATAERLSAQNLGERITVPDSGNELGQLGGTLNAMLERLDDSFAQQARFISDAAHELRTPVTVMLTQTQTALLRERPAEQYRQSLEACQRAADRMRQLIESLLALARLDSGDQPMKRLRFDLGRAIVDQMELMEPLAASRGISLIGDINPLPMEGDPDYLTVVIANLLTNAIHYNRDGGSVKISLCQEENEAVICIADTGLGMTPETLNRIFDRFYRADQSRSLPTGRTGLGLAITKSIVDAHRGTITVKSIPEQGSTFTVRIPLVVPQHLVVSA
jgi:heavy metal sensor kinase